MPLNIKLNALNSVFHAFLNVIFCFKYCNDLFSRFEQQILFLEKLAETTDPTTDHHRHDGPSRGSRSKTLRLWKTGYWEQLSELRDGREGRTVVGTTDRHRLFNEFDSLNFVTEAAGRTVAGTMGRHGLRNPEWVGFLLKVFKGCFGLFLLMIIKLVV